MPNEQSGSLQKNRYGFYEITPSHARILMEEHPDWIIVDVRTREEYKTGRIRDAIVLPLSEIEARASEVVQDVHQPLLVYCHSGRRSKIASALLAAKGYDQVYEFEGVEQWPYGLNS